MHYKILQIEFQGGVVFFFPLLTEKLYEQCNSTISIPNLWNSMEYEPEVINLKMFYEQEKSKR